MKYFIVGLVTLLVFLNSSVSAAQSEDSLSIYQITNVNDVLVQEISEKFEITKKIKNGYEVLVPEERASEFLNLVPNAELIEESRRLKVKSWFQKSFTKKRR